MRELARFYLLFSLRSPQLLIQDVICLVVLSGRVSLLIKRDSVAPTS